MKIQSSAFNEGQFIPVKYSCEGENVNPPLDFLDVPVSAKSLVLLVEDPDAPSVKPWVHWVVFNIDPSMTGMEENVKQGKFLEGFGTGNIYGYQGPCPPSGVHRYQFRLYALNSVLELSSESDRVRVLKEMDGKILASAVLTGLYEKQNIKQRV